MNTILLDGKALSAKILQTQKELIQEKGLHPELLILRIGENPASEQYVALKKRRAEEVGITVVVKEFPKDISFEELHLALNQLLTDQPQAGILIQLPLSSHLPTQQILDLVPQNRDIDGLHSANLVGLTNGTSHFAPAVAVGVLGLITEYHVAVANKSVIVLGKGIYVGKPIADMIEQKYNTTVIRIDIQTPNPKELLKTADVVISCIGKPHLYKVSDLKAGAVLIDVGTSEDPVTGKIVGDFDKSTADGYLSAYTPVPGGVGPMTVASLLQNVVNANLRN